MFNSKKIKELEGRIWQLENPPHYKVGDKIKVKNETFVITSFKFDYFYKCYDYTIVNIKTGKTKTI